MIRSLVIATIFIATCALSTGAEAKKHPKTATHAAYANRADAMEFANDLADAPALAQVHATLCGEFDAPPERIGEDLLALVGQLSDAGLVQVSPGPG